MFIRTIAAVTIGLVFFAPAASSDETVVMPYCQTEDGSDYPNRPCLWVDPDTGVGYVNSYSVSR